MQFRCYYIAICEHNCSNNYGDDKCKVTNHFQTRYFYLLANQFSLYYLINIGNKFLLLNCSSPCIRFLAHDARSVTVSLSAYLCLFDRALNSPLVMNQSDSTVPRYIREIFLYSCLHSTQCHDKKYLISCAWEMSIYR